MTAISTLSKYVKSWPYHAKKKHDFKVILVSYDKQNQNLFSCYIELIKLVAKKR